MVVQMQPPLSDAEYIALDYDAWQRHVYTTGDQRFNTICMGCSIIEAVDTPLRSDTLWWVCGECFTGDEAE